ncbi:FadR/GntR family transcriptional regulator [Maridesulfovibrio sp.]|uniref:FadR/GntR family transcriptional regulator n=1 Tax=Maridesulfovibrio sp. TaxID=2795000 RepID=UPI003BA89EE0
MASTQRPILCQKITTMLQGKSFSIGDRLPGERRLAEMFNTSRNTVREALCNLESMGYLEIREKSGCYLKNKEGCISWEMLRKRKSIEASRQLVETLYLVVPGLVRTETLRLSPSDISELETVTSKLGEAIVNFDLSMISRVYISFFRSLAEVSNNGYLILLLKELELAAKNLEHAGTGLSEVQIDALFAYHVELFNALKTGQPEQAEKLAKYGLQTFSQMVLPDS